MRDVDVTSAALPGGSLVSAALDRRVMALADRGQASGAIGDRWAAITAEAVDDWGGGIQTAPGGQDPFHIDRVVRLDDVPQVAATASRRGLQNPDFLVVGNRDDETVIQGLDAKFSAETAKPRQVSAEIVRNLLELRHVLTPLTGELPDNVVVVDGMFLCPDYPLTHLVFTGRAGIVRPAVSPHQVMLIDAPALVFFDSVDGGELIARFADIDAPPIDVRESLLASLYYFRLVRAVAGIQSDECRPLLDNSRRYVVSYGRIADELPRRSRGSSSAWGMVRDWDRDADFVRNQRQAVEQVAGLPIIAGELRLRIEQVASGAGRLPPSVNKVRRRLGGWYRQQLRERVGPVEPPVDDLDAVLRRVGAAGRQLMPELERETEQTIDDLIAEAPARDELTLTTPKPAS